MVQPLSLYEAHLSWWVIIMRIVLHVICTLMSAALISSMWNYLKLRFNKIGEKSSKQCNESVLTNPLNYFGIHLKDFLKVHKLVFFWLRQELRESLCVCVCLSDTNLSKALNLHLSLIGLSQICPRSVTESQSKVSLSSVSG